MPPVLFYGVSQGCSFGSIVALEWLRRPYHLCRIERIGHLQDPLYSQVNPLMKTPALLLDNGDILSESLAILMHLAIHDPDSPLGVYPGTVKFDRLCQTLAYLHTDVFSAFAPLRALVETRGLTTEQRELLYVLGREQIARCCAHLNGLLEGRDWLLGERSLADAYLSGIARRVGHHRLFGLQRNYPYLARYLRKLQQDPAVRFAQAIEEVTPTKSGADFRGHIHLKDLRPRLAA
ncbi:glutathione S-transferase family protein [Microbulbifer rhizosphaerae]|uniref:Glutathione S-transferase n=1 Tax=Microbulbifer rhizosphaerae TaxID=1562603 RepID=A0A7W4WEA2_9GAMM|nr:glutathione S-transferase family protein [Microbulbifer rhizosphaerae]MBB3062658.1 glutathione S-transferase [Microbulbifer rhizosphaerae]